MHVYANDTMKGLLGMSTAASPGSRTYEFTMYLPRMSKTSSDCLHVLCRRRHRQLFIEEAHNCDNPIDFFFFFREKRPGLQTVYLVKGGGVPLHLSLIDASKCCSDAEVEAFYANVSFAGMFSYVLYIVRCLPHRKCPSNPYQPTMYRFVFQIGVCSWFAQVCGSTDFLGVLFTKCFLHWLISGKINGLHNKYRD